MKYIVVLWIETNETSVMEENAVRDTGMLTNCDKREMVYHKEIGKKSPKGGWKAYLARVVSIHDTLKEAKKSELAFVNETESLSGTNSSSCESTSISQIKSRKRKKSKNSKSPPVSSISSDESETNAVSVSTPVRKKLSTLASKRSLINNFADNGSDSEELSNLTRHELVCMVQGLQKKNKLLMEQMHNELPGMLVQALSSNVVVHKMAEICGVKATKAAAPFFISPNITRPVSPSVTRCVSPGVAQPTSPSVARLTSSGVAQPASPSVTQCSSPGVARRASRCAFSFSKKSSQNLSPQHNLPANTDLPLQRAQETRAIPQPDANQSSNRTSPRDQLIALFSPNALQEVDRSKNHSKMAKTLLAILFERATLQKSFLTGKGSGEILDPVKVKLITDYVISVFPGTTLNNVRNAITQKVKDEKEASKRKRRAEEEQK